MTETLTPPVTLGSAARQFFSHPSPWILAGATAAVAVGRATVGNWNWRDAVVAAVILGLEPVTEWVIHVFLLHFRPRQVLGHRVDLYLAVKHREHHRDPKDPVLVFVPLRVLVISLAVAAVGWWVLATSHAVAFTGLLTSYAMFLLYEWTHFLIHTSYRPKSRLYRYVWRAHRLHHYRNEHYWFGVTIHLADHVLGTFPEKDAVPVSPTARTLGADAA